MSWIHIAVVLAVLFPSLPGRTEAGERVRVEIPGLPPVAVATGDREDLASARFQASPPSRVEVELPTIQPPVPPRSAYGPSLAGEARPRTWHLSLGLDLEDVSATGEAGAPPASFREGLRSQGLDLDDAAVQIAWAIYSREPTELGEGVRAENAAAQVLGSELSPEEAEQVRRLATAPAELEVQARRSFHLRSEPWAEAVLSVPSGATLETGGVGDGLEGWIQVRDPRSGRRGWAPAMWMEAEFRAP